MLAIGSPDDPADNPRVTDLSRYADFLAFLDEQHAADPDLRAAWVGGSAATGGYDEWSDLDVEVLCAPGTYLDVYRRLLAAIRERFAPPDVWELLESTYLDGRQCFVTLDPSPGALAAPTRLVDVVVWETTDEHRHRDVRRHGSPSSSSTRTGSSSSATTTRRIAGARSRSRWRRSARSDRSASGW